jgi:two-component system response regulator TctD
MGLNCPNVLLVMRILLVEDNRELAELIALRFNAEGSALDWESNGQEALQLLRHKQFDLVILDINLPGASGVDVLNDVRARNDNIPIIVLTARSNIADRINILDVGADDYLTKPFDFGELAARCRAVVRRRSGQSSNLVIFGKFQYDRRAKRVLIDGVEVELQAREVQLLEVFLSNLGRVMSKEDVADKIYTFSQAPSLNAVEQTVTRLRKKLEGSDFAIRTIRGLGYLASANER